MSQRSVSEYVFEGYRVDPKTLELRDPAGVIVEAAPNTIELLIYLIENADRVVSKQELFERLWPHVVVNENALAQCVWAARKAVGDAGRAQRVIKNVRGRGYRFVADLEQTEVSSAPRERRVLESGPPPPGSELVGRDEDLSALGRELSRGIAGEGRICLVAGEAGIGKTRLLEELGMRARARGYLVLEGRSVDDESMPPFWPWKQILASYEKQVDDDALRASVGSDGADLARLNPRLRQRLPGLGSAPERETDDDRYFLFQATTECLLRASQRQPLFIVFDDAHWADIPSLSLLTFLAPYVARGRIVLCVAYRHDELDPPRAKALDRVGGQPSARRWLLGGLVPAMVGDLLRLVGRAEPAHVVERIAAVTAGNPFFVTQFAGSLDGVTVISEQDIERLELPDALQSVLARRLDRVPKSAETVLHVIAVLGLEMHLSDIRRTTGLSADAVLERLEVLVGQRIIQAVPGEVGAYRFLHPLLREAVYRKLSNVERMTLHRDVARAIEQAAGQFPAARLDELAHHFCAATPLGTVDQAVRYSELAARQAFEAAAYEESVRHYRRALSALDLGETPNEVRRCELLLGLGHALRGARESAEAVRAAFGEVAERSTALDDAELFAEAALGYAGYGPLRLGQLTEMGAVDTTEVELLSQAVARLGEPDSPKKALCLAWLGRSLYHSAEGKRRADAAREAVAMARRLADPRLVARTLLLKQQLLRSPHFVRERLEDLTEVIGIARGIGAREIELDARHERAWAYVEVADVSAAEADIQVVGRIADENQHPSERRVVELWNLVHAYVRENVDEVEARDRERYMRRRTKQAGQAYSVRLMMARYIQGRAEETLSLMEGYAEQFPLPVSWQCGLASTYATVGRFDDARRVFEDLAASGFQQVPMTHDWLSSYALLANAAQILGDRSRAVVLRDILQPFEGHVIIYGIGTFIGGIVSRSLGDLHRVLEDYDEAERCYRLASGIANRLRSPSNLAWIEVDWAELLCARGSLPDRVRAEALLARAEPVIERLGLGLLRERVSRIWPQLGSARQSRP